MGHDSNEAVGGSGEDSWTTDNRKKGPGRELTGQSKGKKRASRANGELGELLEPARAGAKARNWDLSANYLNLDLYGVLYNTSTEYKYSVTVR